MLNLSIRVYLIQQLTSLEDRSQDCSHLVESMNNGSIHSSRFSAKHRHNRIIRLIHDWLLTRWQDSYEVFGFVKQHDVVIW